MHDKLENFIGKFLKLMTVPEGKAGQIYKLTAGRNYRISEVRGHVLVFHDDDDKKATAHYTRFKIG